MRRPGSVLKTTRHKAQHYENHHRQTAQRLGHPGGCFTVETRDNDRPPRIEQAFDNMTDARAFFDTVPAIAGRLSMLANQQTFDRIKHRSRADHIMKYTKRNKIPKNSEIDWSKSDAQIAREIGCHASNICRRRHQAKIAPVTPHKHIVVDWRDQPWETQNDTQIAKMLGCSSSQVREKRREYARHLTRPRHTNFVWAGQDWTQHDSQIAKARGLSRGAVSSARYRYSRGVKAPRKPGKRQTEQAQAAIHAEERKTLHQWLNKLGTPTHEKTGLPMCLLRRLAVQLGVQPWEAPTP